VLSALRVSVLLAQGYERARAAPTSVMPYCTPNNLALRVIPCSSRHLRDAYDAAFSSAMCSHTLEDWHTCDLAQHDVHAHLYVCSYAALDLPPCGLRIHQQFCRPAWHY
jgi:hypothetical protein